MKVNLEIENGVVVGYRTYPIDETTCVEYTDAQMKYINRNLGKIDKDLRVVDNEFFVDNINELREKRYEILKAFDIYKSNVNYGIEEESEEEKKEILLWYRAILDLIEESINNIPLKIKKYM